MKIIIDWEWGININLRKSSREVLNYNFCVFLFIDTKGCLLNSLFANGW